ncbi:inositol monophosphatase family protein [Bifidobacterium sp. 64T4]|uniref:inositol monophosphatase family protein n=1 Tax=Bifidobacterium pongonis TaxID=2834432 RepID=UPI001C5676E0|nr:inositol monophosphatase family protein [Bifidobacterium pongonis]MBW3094616.1 inositol monophosphatase family protein [Bifidobacterium pongonis]
MTQENLRELAMKVVETAKAAGVHALQDQLNSHGSVVTRGESGQRFAGEVDNRLLRYVSGRLADINHYDGFWQTRPAECRPGQRYWCVGKLDGAINYVRNMSEWAVTISLFEFNWECSAQPILGVVHAPALGETYVAVRGGGAVRIRNTPLGEKREKVVPSVTPNLEGSVVSFGMSYVPGESDRALAAVSALAGHHPADVKRVGPASLDLCKVADGTYDAYFEPELHEWDVPAISAAAVVVWEAQGALHRWDGNGIHWRQNNDIVCTNGLIDRELKPILSQY